MLIDELDLKKTKALSPIVGAAISRVKANGARYVFSNEVATAIGNLIRDYPEFIIQNWQFGLPTYKNMVLEIGIDTMLKATDRPNENKGDSDEIVNYVIEGDNYYVIAKGMGETTSIFSLPIVYSRNNISHIKGLSFMTPWRDENSTMEQISIKQLVFMLGTTMAYNNDSITNEFCGFLLKEWAFRMEREYLKWLKPEYLDDLIMGSTGEVRNIVALLLWLNQPNLLDFVDMPAQRKWYNRRNISYAKHHVLKLKKDLTPKKIFRTFQAMNPSPKRRHEVAAFWRNFDKNPNCVHEWPLYPNENGQFHCPKCGQWRVRVKQHERGDATIGFVTKGYQV